MLSISVRPLPPNLPLTFCATCYAPLRSRTLPCYHNKFLDLSRKLRYNNYTERGKDEESFRATRFFKKELGAGTCQGAGLFVRASQGAGI